MELTCILKGIFVDTPTSNEIRCRDGYAFVKNGRFEEFSNDFKAEWEGLRFDDYSGKMILPGITDMHLHAPQYAYAGSAMDVELIDWLKRYTYPEEAKYGNLEYAKEGYRYLVDELRDSVTTRSCIFATIHTGATIELMKMLDDAGQISFVGKLNMNRNAPEDYCEKSTEAGMAETLKWLDACEESGFQRSKPIITPRFTPSVTDDYMKELGILAKERKLPIQSHLSENPKEIGWVSRLCPDTSCYAQTYERYGLFGKTSPTVMAHCVYSGDEEMRMLKENGVYIAHCPTSNENLISGISPAAYYLRNGFNICLGSDVAGGHTLNMFEVMRAAIQCSKLRFIYVDRSQKPLSMTETLYMTTVVGGKFFGNVGLFETGYEFDAVVIDDSCFKNNRETTTVERLEKYIYRGDGKAFAKYVAGKKIK